MGDSLPPGIEQGIHEAEQYLERDSPQRPDPMSEQRKREILHRVLQEDSQPLTMSVQRRREILARLERERGIRLRSSKDHDELVQRLRRERERGKDQGDDGEKRLSPVEPEKDGGLHEEMVAQERLEHHYAPPSAVQQETERPSTASALVQPTREEQEARDLVRRLEQEYVPSSHHQPRPASAPHLQRPKKPSRGRLRGETIASRARREALARKRQQQAPKHKRSESTTITRLERERWIAENSKPRKKYDEDVARRRREQSVEEQCTFAPRIHYREKKKLTLEELKERNRRMYDLGMKKAREAAEKLRKRQEEEEMQKFSFHPAVVTDHIVDPEEHVPLHLRLEQVQQERNAHRKQLKKKRQAELEKEMSFQPKVNSHGPKTSETPAAQRLYECGQRNMDRKTRIREAVEKEMGKMHTFEPKINPTSTYILRGSERYGDIATDFAERQRVFIEERDEYIKALRKAQEKSLTFQPMTNPVSAVLAETAARREGETFWERIERLGSTQEQDAAREAIAAKYYGQLTFTPQINPLSREHGRPSDIGVIDGDRERVRERVQREAREARELAFQETCTFQPRVNTAGVESHYGIGKDGGADVLRTLERDESKRKKKLEEERMSKVQKEMSECSFAPTVNTKVPKSIKRPVPIRGMGKFLAKQERARLLKAQKEAREREVFSVRDSALGPPKPFHLSTSSYATKRQRRRLKKEARAVKEMKACTFEPDTEHTRNRKIVDELLKEEDG